MINILIYGIAPEEHHEAHSLFHEETTFFEAHGQLTMNNLTILSDELHPNGKATDECKYQYLRTHLFGTIDEKLQKRLSQNTSSHKRRDFLALKLLVDRVAQANRESFRLAEKEIHAILVSTC